MSEATFKTTSGCTRPPLTPDLIDLDDHPDADLLRLCSYLARLRGQLEALERCIEAIPAVSPEGRRFKEMSL